MVCSLQVCRLQSEGYYGGMRLLMAICKVFYNYCSDNKIELKGGNFTLSYETNIPRQVKFWANLHFVGHSYIRNCLVHMAFYFGNLLNLSTNWSI